MCTAHVHPHSDRPHVSNIRGSLSQRSPCRADTMAARKLIPLLDRVLVERVQAAVKTAGGVLLPESVLPKVSTGSRRVV